MKHHSITGDEETKIIYLMLIFMIGICVDKNPQAGEMIDVPKHGA